MNGVRIAAATKVFGQPFRKALHMAAAAEADGVQIDPRDELRPADITGTALRHVRKMLEEANLRVAGGEFLTRRGLIAAQELQRRIEAVVAAMELVSRLGGKTLTVNLGAIPASDAPGYGDARQALELVAAAGQRHGVMPALAAADAEPGELLALLGCYPEGTLGVEFNPAELIAAGRSPGEWMGECGRQIVHFRATDAVPGLGGRRAVEVELGRGVAEAHELTARLLDEFGYQGWATVGRAGAGNPEEEVRNAAAYLRSCGAG